MNFWRNPQTERPQENEEKWENEELKKLGI